MEKTVFNALSFLHEVFYKKVAVSKILYLLSGILLLSITVTKILPFSYSFSCKNFKLLYALQNSSPIIYCSLISIGAYIIIWGVWDVFKKNGLTYIQEDSQKKFHIIAFTAIDISDLICSFFMFLFAFSVTVQFILTHNFFHSHIATIIYLWIIIKNSYFIITHICYKNLLIVNSIDTK